MAVIIRKYQNDNKNQTHSYGKWYPRVVNLKTIDLDGLCEHITSHGSIFTPDVVTGVVKKFVGCIQELLLDSHKVRLDGIGTFYLKPRLKTGKTEDGATIYGGAETLEELNFNNIEFSVGFTPDRSQNSNFVGPNITRKSARVSFDSLSPQADGEGGEGGSDSGSGQQQGGGTSGSVEEQP